MEQEQPIKYREFLEKLKIEIGVFLSLAEAGTSIPWRGLLARKQSKKVEALLLEYRKRSRLQDKRNKEIVKQAKKCVENLDAGVIKIPKVQNIEEDK